MASDLLARARDILEREREEAAVREKERESAAAQRLETRCVNALDAWLTRQGIEMLSAVYRGPTLSEEYTAQPETRLIVDGVVFGYREWDPDAGTYPLVVRTCDFCGAEVVRRVASMAEVVAFHDGPLGAHHTGETREGDLDIEWESCDGAERWYEADRRPKREPRPRHRIAHLSTTDNVRDALTLVLDEFEDDAYTCEVLAAGDNLIVIGRDARSPYPTEEPF